jgi:hypothetical protein
MTRSSTVTVALSNVTRRTLCGWLVVSAAAAEAALAQPTASQKYPDIISATVKPRGADVFDFDVTVSSPYDTLQRYADAFRALTLDRKVLGERVLLHDHQTEQPFTRDLYGIKIPADIKRVIIEGRDQLHGWGGKTIEVALPGR